ncbi:inosine-uridine preferring nucleoside hydrolase [Penicillium brasilianum]|uniref:Inosine-uridine preferring nucleoside hydrolase n=1 Tax=Penicillium brasilianum TaxID=104259 RepID=A0A1S9RWS4_PENBI|nr:inosine-uridine preferring nucleoside hydrolase [Penicillium brasilianum]
MLWRISLSALSLAAGAVAKHYAIMDNDWYTAGFVPYLIALDGDIDVLALASDTANSWQPQVALHAVATLEAGNLSCIPVYPGATWPLINTPERFQAWETIHGKLPWEGAFAPENATAEAAGNDPTSGDPNRIVKAAFKEGFPKGKPNNSTSAANFMVEMVHKYPGRVSIYSAGALTNVALAVRMDPDFASLAKQLVIMGGYVDLNMLEATGSIMLADYQSDINLMIDPEASKIALTADFPNITIAGNVANQVFPTQKFVDEVKTADNAYAQLFAKYYDLSFPFWDETAAALMVDPTIATNQTSVYLDVDTSYGSPNYGNIHVYQKALAPGGIRQVNYVFEVDAKRLTERIKHSLMHPKTCADLK